MIIFINFTLQCNQSNTLNAIGYLLTYKRVFVHNQEALQFLTMVLRLKLLHNLTHVMLHNLTCHAS